MKAFFLATLLLFKNAMPCQYLLDHASTEKELFSIWARWPYHTCIHAGQWVSSCTAN
jgi:hypothetical protein